MSVKTINSILSEITNNSVKNCKIGIKENKMYNSDTWDWNSGRRLVTDLGKWRDLFKWIEEFYVSPDGEIIASVVKTGEAEFGVCENGETWGNSFDKIWFLKFGPDNRLTALVSSMGEWTLAVDGVPWENRFEYIWDTKFGFDGKVITAAAQKGRRYSAVSNDFP